MNQFDDSVYLSHKVVKVLDGGGFVRRSDGSSSPFLGNLLIIMTKTYK
jgi:hypothetical protein